MSTAASLWKENDESLEKVPKLFTGSFVACFMCSCTSCALIVQTKRKKRERGDNHCVAAWCVCISFHFSDHTKCFYFTFFSRVFFLPAVSISIWSFSFLIRIAKWFIIARARSFFLHSCCAPAAEGRNHLKAF